MQKSATFKKITKTLAIFSKIVYYISSTIIQKTNTERNNDPELSLFPSELLLFGLGVSDIMVFVRQKYKGA